MLLVVMALQFLLPSPKSHLPKFLELVSILILKLVTNQNKYAQAFLMFKLSQQGIMQ